MIGAAIHATETALGLIVAACDADAVGDAVPVDVIELVPDAVSVIVIVMVIVVVDVLAL